MTVIESLVLALAFVIAPTAAAVAVLFPSHDGPVVGMLGVFVGGGALLWIDQEPRIGLYLAVTGLACSAIVRIGMDSGGRPGSEAPMERGPAGRAFRLAAILLFGTSAWGLSGPLAETIPVESGTRVTCALVVVGIGLLQTGMTQKPGQAGVGLLIALAGFEILYSGLEPALAVRAALAGIMVGIALVTSLLARTEDIRPAVERRRH